MERTPQMPDAASILKAVYAKEEADARAFMKMLAAGVRYPDGKPPRMGVTMIRDWLLDRYDEDSFEAHLLNLIEIHDDDAGWSVNGVSQGEPWALIEWIVGEMPPEKEDQVEHALEDYECVIGALVMEAHKRLRGNPATEGTI